MKKTLALIVILFTLIGSVVDLRAQGTDFTYQGFLTDLGAPANGVYDLQLTVFNAVAAGAVKPVALPPAKAPKSSVEESGMPNVSASRAGLPSARKSISR